jgi:tetratricopeptide (TPR) repeat protein
VQRRLLTALLIATLLALVILSGYIAAINVRAWYHHRQAEKAIASGKFEEGLAHLELCLRDWKKDGETYFLAARTARRHNDYDKAEKYLNKAKEFGWVKETIQLEWALLRAQRGNSAEVEGYLQECIRKEHPDTVFILEALAQGALTNFHLSAALVFLERWLQIEPDNVRAIYWRGYAREFLQMEDDAISDYRRALEVDPDHDDARLHLGELLLRHRADFQGAAEQFEQLHDREPDKPAVKLGLARAYRGLRRREEARLLLDQILRHYPHDARALAERGRIAGDSDQLAEAEEYFRRSIKEDPSDPDAIADLIATLRELKKLSEARRWEKRLEQLKADKDRFFDLRRKMLERPRDPDLPLEAGQIKLRVGQETEALRWFQLALQIDPGHRATHRALADFFDQKGNTELAAHHRRLAGS